LNRENPLDARQEFRKADAPEAEASDGEFEAGDCLAQLIGANGRFLPRILLKPAHMGG
jgi:hypothetical protein